MREKKSFYGLDVMKFICTFFIIAIHVPPLASLNTQLDYGLVFGVARIAVPFYFVASGYLLFRKCDYDNFDTSIVIRYCRKLLKLYFIWYVIYLPENIYSTFFMEGFHLWKGILVILRGFFFCGYKHLWYLQASMISALALVFFIKRKFRIRHIICIGIFLYTVGLLGQNYFVLLKPLEGLPIVWTFLKGVQDIIVTTRNGIFEGILFMGIGMLFAYKNIVMKMKTAVLAFGASVVLGLIEIFMAAQYQWYLQRDCYIALVPAAFFLFYIVCHINLKESPVYYEMRVSGMLIYYVHIFVRTGMSVLIKLLQSVTGIAFENSAGKFMFVCIVSYALAAVIKYCSRQEKLNWLKNIYS